MAASSKPSSACRRAATTRKADANAQLPVHGRQSHGLYALRRAMTLLGGRGLDGRSSLAIEQKKWRDSLVRDLGADITTQQAALVDLACRSRLMLDSIDAWLLTQPSLIDKRHRRLLPVVNERQKLADALARYLDTLGLARRE